MRYLLRMLGPSGELLVTTEHVSPEDAGRQLARRFPLPGELGDPAKVELRWVLSALDGETESEERPPTRLEAKRLESGIDAELWDSGAGAAAERGRRNQ